MSGFAERLRPLFPALDQQVHGQELVYFDNAATTQRPDSVIAAISHFYAHDNANVHRAVHTLSARSTEAYEGARDRIARYLNAASRQEIVFTRGTTEGINLVAQSWLRPRLKAGDEILISGLEHHSNIVPWQLAINGSGARIRVIPVLDDGSLDMVAYRELLSERTRLVAVGYASNAIGTRNPVDSIIAQAHAAGARVLIDGAQAMAHHRVDMQAMGADFFAFSAHKMYGPTGFGVLYAPAARLDEAQPWQGGGDMIETVSFEGSTWNELPYKFEAGTPNIAGAIGTGAAIDFLAGLDFDQLTAHEQSLLTLATEQLQAIPGLRMIGTAPDKAAIVSFVMQGAHPQDIGTLLDENGIAVRTGHHCAMPLMERFGVPGTVRASFAAYNTVAEIERMGQCLHRIAKLFA